MPLSTKQLFRNEFPRPLYSNTNAFGSIYESFAYLRLGVSSGGVEEHEVWPVD